MYVPFPVWICLASSWALIYPNNRGCSLQPPLPKQTHTAPPCLAFGVAETPRPRSLSFWKDPEPINDLERGPCCPGCCHRHQLSSQQLAAAELAPSSAEQPLWCVWGQPNSPRASAIKHRSKSTELLCSNAGSDPDTGPDSAKHLSRCVTEVVPLTSRRYMELSVGFLAWLHWGCLHL